MSLKSLALRLHDRIAESSIAVLEKAIPVQPRRMCRGVAGKKNSFFYQFITVMLGFDWMAAMGTKRVRKS
jgi:hypothetical protein